MTPTDRAHRLSITATGNGWCGYRSGCRVTLVLLAGFLILHQTTIAETLQKQILIEPKFVEVSDRNLRDLGWSARIGEKLSKLSANASSLSSPDASKLGLGTTPSAETVRAHLFPSTNAEPAEIKLCGLITDPQLQAILNSLGREQGVKVVSVPPIRVEPNEPANVEVPFQGGLNLRVVPRINPDGTIGMTVTPETVELSKETGAGTPVINDIPVLGGIFRSASGGGTTGLMIVIEPRIIEVLEPGSGAGGGSTVNVETIGTGDTIGHIADFKIENSTDQQLVFVIPPMILESKSQKSQDYVCPRQENVTLAGHETKTVPIEGVCVNRDKPPVGKGAAGDLVMNTGDPGIPQNPDSHIRPNQARDLLRICTSKYDAADKLQKDGALRDLPYKDKQTQKNIAIQWSTWSDPRISEITGTRPATKDDIKKVVYKQLQSKKPIPPDTKKKVDSGIDTIFEKVELTTKKAKELEPPGTIEIADPSRNPKPIGGLTRNGNNPPASGVVSDDGLPPPALTDKDCTRLRNNLAALLARYNKALRQLHKADLDIYGLEQEGWDANNKLAEGYEDQSIALIEEARDQWKHIDEQWDPAVQEYKTAFEEANKAHDDLLKQRAAFQRMCPGAAPPDIPDLPKKRDNFDPPEEAGR